MVAYRSQFEPHNLLAMRTLRRGDLGPVRVVTADIGRATDVLRAVLAALNYRNLDEEPAFTGRNTTTEFLARVVFDRIVAAVGRGELGAGAGAVESARVVLHESHVASASYEGRIGARP